MNADTIRDLLRRAPFEPFQIRLSNGDTFDVRHPEQVWIRPSRLFFGDPKKEEETLISLDHVNAIRMLHPAESR